MNRIVLGMGEHRVATAEAAEDELWMIYGLGSCIGLLLTDPVRSVSALAHVVQPARQPDDQRPPARFVDTAVPFLLDEMIQLGAFRLSIVAHLVGGAAMFQGLDLEQVGERNLKMARQQLAEHGIPTVAEAVGGTRGRTLCYDPLLGIATYHEAGGAEQVITPMRYAFKEVQVDGANTGGGRCAVHAYATDKGAGRGGA